MTNSGHVVYGCTPLKGVGCLRCSATFSRSQKITRRLTFFPLPGHRGKSALDSRSPGARTWHVSRELCCPGAGACVAETEKRSCIIDVLICANARVFVK